MFAIIFIKRDLRILTNYITYFQICNFQIFLIKFVKTKEKKGNYTIQINIIKKLSLYKIQEPRKLYNYYKKYKNKKFSHEQKNLPITND